jgi:hypothetical protein
MSNDEVVKILYNMIYDILQYYVDESGCLIDIKSITNEYVNIITSKMLCPSCSIYSLYPYNTIQQSDLLILIKETDIYDKYTLYM